MLFAGLKPDQRYSKHFAKLMRTEELIAALAEAGLVPSDMGTHSFRKGSTTHTTSGSPDGPCFYAICRRALWILGTVQEKYVKYQKASDQYVGRVVAGLPLYEADFAVLPPHFDSSCSDAVDDTIRQCFSHGLLSRPRMLPVLMMCLASLVYHSDWLRETVGVGSALFQTRLFTDATLIPRLKGKIVLGFRDDQMVATGVPAHVNLQRAFREMQVGGGGRREVG